MKIKTEKVIEVQEWDDVVKKTYGKPYAFQQQDGCKNRGGFSLAVPDEAEDYENETVPEIVNGEKMGVSFAAWLKRNPKIPLPDGEAKWEIDLWWERNFYPNIQMVANDLHAKKLLKAGEYTINIDW